MCLFCRMVQREVPAKIVDEDEDLLAFHDINPAAPTHVLIVPKKHISSLSDASDADAALLGKLMRAAHRIAEKAGIDKSGYRTVVNTGPNAGQSVFHLHVHVIGGRPMAWPPG